MNLYLIRHGDSETDKPDEQRALTKEGQQAASKASGWVTKNIEKPQILFASPLKRAQETAEPFAKGWDVNIEKAEWLRANVEPSAVIEELKKRKEQNVVLVGHLPNLGLLLGALVWGLPPKEVVIPKCGIAYLEVKSWEPGNSKLKWMITPDLMS